MNKFLDMTPPVAAARRAGAPVVVLETGYFCSLPYPQNLQALQAAEQVIWQKSGIPAPAAVINGRLKLGLSPAEETALMKHRSSATRAELPGLAARGLCAAARPSATLAIAALADIIPVILPGYAGEVSDTDALAIYGCLAFCHALSEDVQHLLAARSIPVLQETPKVLADAWCIQRALEAPESTVCAAGNAISTLCAAACDTALELKKRSSFSSGG